MPVRTYGRLSLTGGAAGALDSIDGANLIDGDRAIVMLSTEKVYFYRLDASSGAVESSPDIIAPDSNPGNKRWLKSNPVIDQSWHDDLSIESGPTSSDELMIYDITGAGYDRITILKILQLSEAFLDRAVVGGGRNTGGNYQEILYFSVSSLGNSSSFGDLTVARGELAATSNGLSDRGVFAGGYNAGARDTIDYVAISIAGNATNFGDLTSATRGVAATSNGTSDRGVIGGGDDGSYTVTVEYITISSAGDATNFGDLTAARRYLSATSNGTSDRGVFGGGATGTPFNTMDYVTISSAGNATNFGDLTISRGELAAASNGTSDRGVFGGGWDGSAMSNVLDYVTISSAGNATNFGDLTTSRNTISATSNGTGDRGVWVGGQTTFSQVSTGVDTMDYVTISSTGDATDFGNLTSARSETAATSNA